MEGIGHEPQNLVPPEQATNWRWHDRTARTGDQNSHRASLSARFAATRSEAQVMLSLS
jgi:hypothetical protein